MAMSLVAGTLLPLLWAGPPEVCVALIPTLPLAVCLPGLSSC